MEAKQLRQIAWNSLTGNYWLSVLVALIAGILGGLIVDSSVNINIDMDALEKWFDTLPVIVTFYAATLGSIGSTLSVAHFVVGGVVQLGYAQYLLKQQSRLHLDVSDLFSQFHRFKDGFLQGFLRGLYVFLWSLLFVIPGIIKSYSYAMTPFIMADNPNMTAKEAINVSKELMDSHKYDLFWLDLTFIGWDVLNLLTLGIGSFFLNPYRNAAHAAFYRNNIAPKMVHLQHDMFNQPEF